MNLTYSLTVSMLLLAGGLTAQENSIKNSPTPDSAPEVYSEITNIEAIESAENVSINLRNHFSDPDDASAILSYELTAISNPAIAEVSLSEETLTIDFLSPGQTNVHIKASNNALSCTDTFVIGVRPSQEMNLSVASFDDLSLNQNSFWNGDDETGSFVSGPARFINHYNPDWFAWNGWAYSNTSDNTTAGFMNQYSAVSAIRLDSSKGKNYAVTYIAPYSEIVMSDSADHEVLGFFVTNSTYAALSMKWGDDYTKKFGGADGSEPDWFQLNIMGYSLNGDSATVEFKLADFTFEDNSTDYIIETWQWIDLTSLGDVYRLKFTLNSTDIGDWGMNTPSYFCMDNLLVGNRSARKDFNQSSLTVFPNPSSGTFKISGVNEKMKIRVYDMFGREVYYSSDYYSGNSISLNGQKAGSYFIKIDTGKTIEVKQIVVQ